MDTLLHRRIVLAGALHGALAGVAAATEPQQHARWTMTYALTAKHPEHTQPFVDFLESAVRSVTWTIHLGLEGEPPRLVVTGSGDRDRDKVHKLLATLGPFAVRDILEPTENPPPGALEASSPYSDETLFLLPESLLAGRHIATAIAWPSADFGPTIQIILTDEGRTLFADASRKRIGNRLALMLGDTVLTAPLLAGAITGGRLEITGRFSWEDAQSIALALRLSRFDVTATLLAVDLGASSTPDPRPLR